MSADYGHRCPKCAGQQETGLVIDSGHTWIHPSRWVEGAPEASWWQGTKTSGLTCRKVEYWRCTKCGFLEAYANEKVDPPSFFGS